MSAVKFGGFDWNEGNLKKVESHGISLAEIEWFFLQGKIHVAPDPKHSGSETRFLAIGPSPMGRPMIVAFTMRKRRGERLIRPISARYMHEREAMKYVEAFTEDEN